MGDNNHLRMIANPFLLKQENNKHNSLRQKNTIRTNHFLYLYIEKKYPLKYIPPNTFYEIIELIDNKIIEHEINEIIKDIIQSIIIKFDIINNTDDTINTNSE